MHEYRRKLLSFHTRQSYVVLFNVVSDEIQAWTKWLNQIVCQVISIKQILVVNAKLRQQPRGNSCSDYGISYNGITIIQPAVHSVFFAAVNFRAIN